MRKEGKNKEGNLPKPLPTFSFFRQKTKENERKKKKSARLAGTFSLRAWRAARSGIFERRASRSVLSGPRASRSVLFSSHTFKYISYNLILKLKTIL